MKKQAVILKNPARSWDKGLPLGNGRLGAMIMGKLKEETIFLNEETLCFGPPRDRENPDARKMLEPIRGMLLEGRVEEAAFYAKMALASSPKYNNPYQPLGDLRLCFPGEDMRAEEYESRLELEEGIARVAYRTRGMRYEREHFISREYNVLAIRIRALSGTDITMSANISRKPFEEFTGKLDGRTAGNWGENGAGGMHYLSGVRIADSDAETLGDAVFIKGQREITVYLAAATDYEDCLAGARKDGEEAYRTLKETVLGRLDRAEAVGYEEVRRRHLEDYQRLYGNFSLRLGGVGQDAAEGREESGTSVNGLSSGKEPEGSRVFETGKASKEGDEEKRIPSTGELLAGLREGDRTHEHELINLLFACARYLMIASSENCLLPANLQGIWNGSYEPPWQCEFTININEEMNYWFVEKAGLSACHMPLFELLKRIAENGAGTARKLYGCRGFVAHHNTNVWGSAAPEGIFDASPYWVTGGAWLCNHLFEHYRYTEDREFLEKEAMPLAREAIRFFEDYLYEMPDGTLVTGPVVSPENTYRSKVGQVGALCMGTAMDSSILRQLITSYLEAMKVLGREEEQAQDKELLESILKKLPPLRIGSDGRLLEWMEEYQETEPGHRHISHLYGLHPGREITPETPETFAAAGKTLEYRLHHGGGHTGWSRAWAACFAARLLDGEAVGEHVRQLLCKCIQDNMLDVHPPFQIDGNFGIAESILEALVQERSGKIYLLPALPPEWPRGEIKGYCLTGNARLSFAWKEGQVTELAAESPRDRELIFMVNGYERRLACPAGEMTTMQLESVPLQG